MTTAKNHHNWLRQEIERWIAEGVIDVSQGVALHQRYPEEEEETSWGRLLFSVLGAVIFGLGIILFFAYNWSAIPKFAKLGVVFGSLLLAHGLGLYYTLARQGNQSMSEGMHTIGTMLFGAGIWLIAQIYHLDEHYPTALLVWGTAALTLSWALPSIAQAVITLFLFCLWSAFEVYDFGDSNYIGPGVVFFAVLPLAWYLRSRVLLFFTLVALFVQLVISTLQLDGAITFYLVFFLACFCIMLSSWMPRLSFPEGSRVLRVVGYLVYLAMLYSITFSELLYELPTLYPAAPYAQWVVTSAGIAVLIAWLATLVAGHWRGNEPLSMLANCQVALSAALLLLLFLHWLPLPVWALVLVFNSLFIAHCIVVIVLGARRVSARQVSLGCIMLVAILGARFTDLFDSLLLRSLMFVVLGASLFAVSQLYARYSKAGRLADA